MHNHATTPCFREERFEREIPLSHEGILAHSALRAYLCIREGSRLTRISDEVVLVPDNSCEDDEKSQRDQFHEDETGQPEQREIISLRQSRGVFGGR